MRFAPGRRRTCPAWASSKKRAQARGRSAAGSRRYSSLSLLPRMVTPASDSVELGAPSGDRRGIRDRRARPTTLLSALRWGGRRRGFRRSSEGRRAYVDCLAPTTVAIALFIVISSILDAGFTLMHLQSGGREVNPLMHLALCAGVPVFLGAKTAGTGLGVLVL